MPRYATRMALDEFKKKIAKYLATDCGDDRFELDTGILPERVLRDLSKIQFDFENTNADPDYIKRDWHTLPEWFEGNLLGYHEINGLCFLGVLSGGDWENPLFWIMYQDDKKTLRGYVPENGNVYNHRSKAAYGNDDESDEIEAHYEDLFDWAAIKADILGRILLR